MTKNIKIPTFRDLFKTCHDIQIPVYQRAYSWDKEQYKQFYKDLNEQDGKEYHLGLFIFEHTKGQSTYFVIDGQQRLTTAILFLAALAKSKIAGNEKTDDICGTYLSGGFSTVNDDDEYFKQLTINFSCGDKKAETPSQGKIKKAFDYFLGEFKKLKKEKSEKVANLLRSLEKAKIGIFEIDDKGEASQVFEYQNKRGVDASDFEIIKAYLIHQIYIKSDDSETDINEIQKNISRIYRNLENISEHFTENDILWCWFYLYEPTQANDYNIDDIKRCLSPKNKNKSGNDICRWVKKFFTDFEKITNAAWVLVSKVEMSSEIENLFLIGTNTKPYWPVVMLAVFMKENEAKLDIILVSKLAKSLEIVWFKYEYCNHRRVNDLLKWAYNYFEKIISFDDLCEKINNVIVSGFDGKSEEYKKAISNYLREGDHYSRYTMTRYLLWQYENHLRKMEGLPKLRNEKSHTYNTIEHILPKDKGFSYVHGLGNLALLKQQDNSKASDNPVSHKKKIVYFKYFDKKKIKEAKLLMYRDILSKKYWRRKQEVKERFGKIKKFAMEYFSL
jgi:uncharacterized protein with ParB-like and HNH nuclease domain